MYSLFKRITFTTIYFALATFYINGTDLNAVTEKSAIPFRPCSKKDLPSISFSPPEGQQDEVVTNLFVWRHGETYSNLTKILSGGGDTKALLTETGRQQAINLAKKIVDLQIQLQAIYSSDLPRAMDTAQPILAAFSDRILTIIPSAQLRELLHGKYERLSRDVRTQSAMLMFNRELDNLENSRENILKKIEDGTLDRSFFCRIDPISGRMAKKEGAVIDVDAFFQNNTQEPETAHELFYRVYEELALIAEETQQLGLSEIGISTHGAVLSTLINVAQYSKESCFIPVHYQTEPLMSKGELVMPAAKKIENCALAHFRYWHKSKHLQFCGML